MNQVGRRRLEGHTRVGRIDEQRAIDIADVLVRSKGGGSTGHRYIDTRGVVGVKRNRSAGMNALLKVAVKPVAVGVNAVTIRPRMVIPALVPVIIGFAEIRSVAVMNCVPPLLQRYGEVMNTIIVTRPGGERVAADQGRQSADRCW